MRYYRQSQVTVKSSLLNLIQEEDEQCLLCRSIGLRGIFLYLRLRRLKVLFLISKGMSF